MFPAPSPSPFLTSWDLCLTTIWANFSARPSSPTGYPQHKRAWYFTVYLTLSLSFRQGPTGIYILVDDEVRKDSVNNLSFKSLFRRLYHNLTIFLSDQVARHNNSSYTWKLKVSSNWPFVSRLSSKIVEYHTHHASGQAARLASRVCPFVEDTTSKTQVVTLHYFSQNTKLKVWLA